MLTLTSNFVIFTSAQTQSSPMLVTLLKASHSSLKELDTTPTLSEQDWRLFPGSWASPWDLGHFASSLGPQFPCLYNWKAGPGGFQECSTLRPLDLDAQCTSLMYLESLWGQGCVGVVGVMPSSGRDQKRELTIGDNRDGILERNSAWEGRGYQVTHPLLNSKSFLKAGIGLIL